MTTIQFEMKCRGCRRILRGSLKVHSPNFKTHKDLFCWFLDCKKQNDFKKEYIIAGPPKN